MTAATKNKIADTILAQIGGPGRVDAMLGVKYFVASERGVSFRFKARATNKANHIEIVLDSNDTYTVKFGRIRGFDFKEIDIVDMVYMDSLKTVIEHRTGLRLSL